MKILILSGIFPTKDNPKRGSFISRRCNVLGDYVKYDLYSFINIPTKFVLIIKKIFKKKIFVEYSKKIKVSCIDWNYILIINSFLYLILKRLSPKFMLKKQMKLLEKEVIIKDYDLIHAHWSYPEGYIAKQIKEKYNIPYIITAHGSDIHTNMEKDKRIMELTLNALEKADKVLFVSNALLEKAKEFGYSGHNSCVVYNGVDKNVFRVIDKRLVRNKLGIKHTQKVVGYVGNLVYVKGADKIPEIFENINKINKNIAYIIVGDGILREQILDKCKQKDINVIFIGSVDPDKVAYYMNAMDVMVVPSRNEGFGNVIIEANACGVAVVGSDAGGIPEAVGDVGIIVEKGNDFEIRFARAVVKLLNTNIDTNKLIKRAYEFDWNIIVQKELEIYKKITSFGGKNE